MTDEERRALAHAHLPWTRGLFALGIAAIIILIVGGAAFIKSPENLEHLLGQSTRQTATVTHIDKASFCSRSTRDQYTLTWGEAGVSRTETIGRCGDPWVVGEELTIWSTDNKPQTDSPWALRISVAAVILGLAVAGAMLWKRRRRVRRAAARAIDYTWHPQTFSTLGMPGAPGFQVNSSPTVRNRLRDWLRVLYKPPVRTAPPPDIPGTLYIDSLRGGRPRGLSLHALVDGTRMWRWHG